MIAHAFATQETTNDLARLAPPPGMQGSYSITEARLWLGGISRPTIYRLMAGKLEWRQVGAARVIPWWSLLAYQRRVDDGEMAGTVRRIERAAPQTQKNAPRRQTQRTQTRNLRSSAKNKKSF